MAGRAKKEKPETPARGTTPDYLYRELKADILSGRYHAGEQLRQNEIAERFGTSRIPVREALRKLAAEDLVTMHVRRGAVVSTISVADVLEMLDIRLGLDCRALRLAIPNMVEDDFARAEEIIAVTEKSQNPSEWTDLNWQFHATLYAPANRPRLFEMIEQLFVNTARYFRVQVSTARGKDNPQAEHRAILAACRAGDVDTAVKLLESHISSTQKIVAASTRTKSFSLASSASG